MFLNTQSTLTLNLINNYCTTICFGPYNNDQPNTTNKLEIDDNEIHSESRIQIKRKLRQ